MFLITGRRGIEVKIGKFEWAEAENTHSVLL